MCFFVDYGNTEKVKKSDLREISEEFLQLPAQSIACRFASISPIDSSAWTDEAKKCFEKLVDEKDELTIYIEGVGKYGPTFVQLLDGETSIGQMLIEEGYAELAAGMEDSKIEESVLESSCVEDTSFDTSRVGDNTMDCSALSPSLAEVMFKPYSRKELNLDEEYVCTVTEVYNPSLFFVLLENDEERENLAEKIKAALSEGGEALDEDSIRVGAACLAKSSSTEEWGRATILSVAETGVEVRQWSNDWFSLQQ